MLKPPDPRVDAVKVVLQRIPPGEVLPYQDVVRQFGFDPQEPEGRSICYRAREKLRRDGIVIEPERGVGFTRLTNTEIARSRYRRKRMKGQIKREKLELSGVKFHELSPEDQAHYTGRVALNRLMGAQSRVPPARMAAVNPTAPGKALLAGLQKACKK